MNKLRRECFDRNCSHLQLIVKKEDRTDAARTVFKCAARKYVRMRLYSSSEPFNCLAYEVKDTLRQAG